jgi:2-phospho-L-lactate guanylyltransferase
VLADNERVLFAQWLLEHVLEVLRDCELDGVLVATDGAEVAELAQARGAQVLRDLEQASLATIVDRALSEVAARGAHSAIVLMADLPRIQPSDVRSLLTELDENDVVLACDHRGRHTNALAIAPPTAIKTCFGKDDSFVAHCTAARDAGLRLAILDNERIAFDIDGPTDHLGLMRQPPEAKT